MIVRKYDQTDLGTMMRIHEQNGLPANCFPELVTTEARTGRVVPNPLFIVKQIVEFEGRPVMGGFIKASCEAYLLVDHTVGTPEERWDWLQALNSQVCDEAWAKGLDEVTVWIPPEILDSFEKRLKDLGFERSKWVSFTKKLG